MGRIDASGPSLLPPRFHQRVLTLTPESPGIETGVSVGIRWLDTKQGRSRCLTVTPENGNATRNFLAMHGNTGSAHDWLAVAYHLAARHQSRAILLEAPGRGLSPRDSRWAYQIPQCKLLWFQEATDQALAEIPLAPVTALLLHSMAGELGLLSELTAMQTKKGSPFSHLVFANPLTPSLEPFPIPAQWHFSRLWAHRLVAQFGRRFAPLYYDRFIHGYAKARHLPWVADWLSANDQMFTGGTRKYTLDFAIGLRGDIGEAITASAGGWTYTNAMQQAWQEIGGLDKPVLWFLDRHDRCVSPRFQDRAVNRLQKHYLAANALPQFRFLESAHGGHMQQVVTPDVVAKTLVAFVDMNER